MRAEAAARESEMEASEDRLKRSFVTDIEELLRITVDSSKRFEEMREVLVNYKREVRRDTKEYHYRARQPDPRPRGVGCDRDDDHRSIRMD